MKPKLVMLAGPNGAGKSTYYESFLSHLDLPFLNADEHVRRTGLSAYESAKEIASLRDVFIGQKSGFITETVFSDPVGEKVDVLRQAAEDGFEVDLIYIGIENPLQSRDRVATRVAAGGHDVPTKKLEGRYHRSLANLRRAVDTLPRVLVYDNSSRGDPYRLLADVRNGTPVFLADALPDWAAFLRKRTGG